MNCSFVLMTFYPNVNYDAWKIWALANIYNDTIIGTCRVVVEAYFCDVLIKYYDHLTYYFVARVTLGLLDLVITWNNSKNTVPVYVESISTYIDTLHVHHQMIIAWARDIGTYINIKTTGTQIDKMDYIIQV